MVDVDNKSVSSKMQEAMGSCTDRDSWNTWYCKLQNAKTKNQNSW